MSNNVYKNCPAKMSDRRFTTYYNSTNELTREIQVINHIPSSNQFRTFLQNNAQTIMNNERAYIRQVYGCDPRIACSEGYYYIATGQYD